MKVIEIKENQINEIINKSNQKILIDCYAPWCGPCRMLSPIIDELSEEVSDCEFYKINVDEANIFARSYGIMSIPTILLFEDNELKETIVGFKTKEELLRILK